MNILIVDQCSGSKSIPENSHVYTTDEIDSSTLSDLLQKQNAAGISARRLYTGRQQQFITEAVNILHKSNHEVDRYFISAGFGLVSSEQTLPPYDVTFSSMSKSDIKERSHLLDLTEDLRSLLSDSDYDLFFFPLGTDYYHALGLTDILPAVPNDAMAVLFNQDEIANEVDYAVSLPARTPQAKERGTIVVALKGRYLQNFAENVTNGMEVSSPEDVVDYCLRGFTMRSEFSQYD